jgi:hypothetical protein
MQEKEAAREELIRTNAKFLEVKAKWDLWHTEYFFEHWLIYTKGQVKQKKRIAELEGRIDHVQTAARKVRFLSRKCDAVRVQKRSCAGSFTSLTSCVRGVCKHTTHSPCGAGCCFRSDLHSAFKFSLLCLLSLLGLLCLLSLLGLLYLLALLILVWRSEVTI